MKFSRFWFWLLLLVPLAFGIARLRLDAEILNLLPQELAVAQGIKVYQQNFSNARELIITVQAPTADDTESAARSLVQLLRAQTNLVAGATWQPAWMENPAEATELIAFLWLNQPPAVFGELTNRLAETNLATTLNETRARLATSLSPNEIALSGYDPYGLMRLPESVSGAAPAVGSGEELFASADGTFRLMFVEARPDITSYRACRSWLAEIQRLVAEARQSGKIPGEVQLGFTGRPVFVTEIAGGMENDMTGSAGGTLVIIGILFWLTHRRLRPLFWLLFLLLMILAGTTALGGLFLGAVNVVSIGFASILLGLAEDFGIVLYQESRSHPELSVSEIRRETAPGIFWSAVTTAGAFLILNFSTLPGLGQLGSLVAIGIILSAVVMLYGYLPLLLRFRRKRDSQNNPLEAHEKFLLFNSRKLLPSRVIWLITALLLFASIILLWKAGPRFDHSPNVLKPKNSEANAVLEQIKTHFGRAQEPLWVLVPGRDEGEVGQKLARVNTVLNQAVSDGLVAGFTLPTALWPHPENQQANRAALAGLVREREMMRAAALGAGFTTNSLFATENILDVWQRALAATDVFWPTNNASRWILNKVVARPGTGFLALAVVHPTTNTAATMKFAAAWPKDFDSAGIILSGWELLGSTVFDTVVRELPRVVLPILLLVFVSLWLAFRNLKEVLLSFLTLAFSAIVLWAAMGLLNWNWNILNLMSLPLLLGMGVDFGIHIQLALRRHDGDLLAVRRSVGRALLLAGATTVAGFGSLAFSTNAGMASLGKACALGLLIAMLTAVYLLPVWWNGWRRNKRNKKATPEGVAIQQF
jgi:predicted RND superfamily exporter protein